MMCQMLVSMDTPPYLDDRRGWRSPGTLKSMGVYGYFGIALALFVLYVIWDSRRLHRRPKRRSRVDDVDLPQSQGHWGIGYHDSASWGGDSGGGGFDGGGGGGGGSDGGGGGGG